MACLLLILLPFKTDVLLCECIAMPSPISLHFIKLATCVPSTACVYTVVCTCDDIWYKVCASVRVLASCVCVDVSVLVVHVCTVTITSE